MAAQARSPSLYDPSITSPDNDVERGLIPGDRKLLGGLVQDVCFGNARQYFGFENLGTGL